MKGGWRCCHTFRRRQLVSPLRHVRLDASVVCEHFVTYACSFTTGVVVLIGKESRNQTIVDELRCTSHSHGIPFAIDCLSLFWALGVMTQSKGEERKHIGEMVYIHLYTQDSQNSNSTHWMCPTTRRLLGFGSQLRNC